MSKGSNGRRQSNSLGIRHFGAVVENNTIPGINTFGLKVWNDDVEYLSEATSKEWLRSRSQRMTKYTPRGTKGTCCLTMYR